MQLSSGISTLLQFALKTTYDVVKSKTALAWGSHTAAHTPHTDEALRLHIGTALRTGSSLIAVKGKCITGAGSRIWVLVMICEGVTRGMLALLLLFCTSGGLYILFSKDADDPSSDFMMYDSLVVFTDDVDTKFLRRLMLEKKVSHK